MPGRSTQIEAAQTFNQVVVSIGATDALLIAAREDRRAVLVKNHHASQVLYVGPEGLTVANGFRINAGETTRFETAAVLWAIASGASTPVGVFEEIN